MKTLEQFLSDYLGKSKGYPTDKEYLGECLSVCKLYIKECFSINPPASGTNSAYGYWSNFPNPLGEVFEKIENTDTLIPEKGWIVIWKPWETNKYGHIAIVKDGNLNNFNSYDQNWGTKIFKEINHTYDNVVGFLKPKSSIISDMTDEQKRILDFLNGKTEGDVREAFGALQEIPNLNKKISDLETSQKSLIERIEQLEADSKANNDLIEGYQTKILTAKSTESKLQAEIESIKSDVQTWKNRYEAKCKETIDKYSAVELISIGLKKLLVKNK